MNRLRFQFLVKTYNFSQYILDYLNSLKYQIINHSDGYIIDLTIVDDCSSDNTVSKVKSWLNKEYLLFNEVKIIINPNNLGVAANQIVTVKSINTNLFHIMDGDDIYNCYNVFDFILKADTYDFYFSPTIRFNYLEFKTTSFWRSLLPFFYFYNSKDKIRILKEFNPLPNPGSRVSFQVLTNRLLDTFQRGDSFDCSKELVGGDLVSWIVAFDDHTAKKGFSFTPYVLYRVGSGVSTSFNKNRTFELDLTSMGYGIITKNRAPIYQIIFKLRLKLNQLSIMLKAFLLNAFPLRIKSIININNQSQKHLLEIIRLRGE
jgi:glycosyltransferase involved in cell wall biosynthesis